MDYLVYSQISWVNTIFRSFVYTVPYWLICTKLYITHNSTWTRTLLDWDNKWPFILNINAVAIAALQIDYFLAPQWLHLTAAWGYIPASNASTSGKLSTLVFARSHLSFWGLIAPFQIHHEFSQFFPNTIFNTTNLPEVVSQYKSLALNSD